MMRTDRGRTAPMNLPLWAVVCWAVAGLLALRFLGCEGEATARDPRAPARSLDAPLTVDQVAGAVGCLARPTDPALHAEYARGVIGACKAAKWQDGLPGWAHVPLLLAIVTQQSRWVADAVSRWNRDETGARILVDKRAAWKRPDARLDYGLTQIHWGAVHRWRPGTRIADLRDPARNLRIGAAWLAKRSGDCAQWMGARTRPGCGRHLGRGASITCRCLAVRRVLGAPTWTGNTDTLVGTFAGEVWRCVDAAVADAEGEGA